MSVRERGGRRAARRVAATVVALGLVAALVEASGAGGAPGGPSPVAGRCGTEVPPEVADAAGGWPLPNADHANTRHVTASRIDGSTVHDLEQVWTYDVPGSALFGNLTTNPVVVDETVYVGALDGSIHAFDLATGAPDWSVARSLTVFGPAGAVVGWGKVFGMGDLATVVAHDRLTGDLLWERDLEVAPGNQINVHPTLLGGCVLVATQALAPGSRGTLYAIDQASGAVVWSFETVPADFWGNPAVNHGGGSWYPPTVDPATGRIWWGTSNPWPSPGAPGFPAGASRPGDNLYTNTVLAFEPDGALRWFHQVFPHDIWDRDMVLTQLVDLPAGGRVLVHTGKGGRVLGYDPDTGALRFDTAVGMHMNDHLTTFVDPTTVLPGVLGGVETPPAAVDGVVYLAVMNAPTTYDSPEQRFSLSPQLGVNPSELVALDAATGAIRWSVPIPGDSLGAVTAVNDLLFVSTFQGLLLAYDRHTGAEVWRMDAPGMVNGWPAVVGDTILWPISGTDPSRVLALRLPPAPPTTTTTAAPSTTTPPETVAPATTSTAPAGPTTPRFTG